MTHEKKETYPDFIIGKDNEGNERQFTCDPKKLSNFFRKFPGAPMYTTLVFFQSDVLKKYYDSPEKYSVEDGLVRHGYEWAIPIDNQNSNYVSAYLGDLGRDLPEQERYHWKSYNIVGDMKLSTAKFKRDMMAEFAEAEATDLIFRQNYEQLNRTFQQELSWSIFKPFHTNDNHCLHSLRVPLNESIVEFENNVIYLVKCLIDSLNEEIFRKYISPDDKSKPGISKLETFLTFCGLNNSDFTTHINFLRRLQKIRSKGAAHRKGSDYEKFCTDSGLDLNNKKLAFEQLLKDANNFLNYLLQSLPSIKSAIESQHNN